MTKPTPANQPDVRLLHASDLHLERPLGGLADVPQHLRELLVEAPYHAAEQVFETALVEDVDAVLLAGDVLDVDRAGPPAIMLLLEQFSRLQDRGIPVYWAGGAVDQPDRWPRSVSLPDNVHRLPVGRVETVELVRGGDLLARVQGTSWRDGGKLDLRGFHRDAHGLLTVGLAYHPDREGDPEAVAGHFQDRVHYMALGGRHKPQTIDAPPGVVRWCGTPQGRAAHETGQHGCTLVHYNAAGSVRTKSIATDSVRWSRQTLEVTATTRQEQLYDRLVERMEKLQAQHPGGDLLVTWHVRGTGPLVNRLRPGGLADELLVDLRRRFGQGAPLAWSVGLECDAPLSVPAEWYDHQTVLGDFLREVRACEQENLLAAKLPALLPAGLQEEPWHAIAELDSEAQCGALLTAAARLGVDLLTLPLEEGDLREE